STLGETTDAAYGTGTAASLYGSATADLQVGKNTIPGNKVEEIDSYTDNVATNPFRSSQHWKKFANNYTSDSLRQYQLKSTKNRKIFLPNFQTSYSNLSKEEFYKEIKVVMEERRWRTDDKPTSQVKEQFASTVFKSHPYSRPVVGWMNDLENMTVEDAREWYQNWYAPNNAILVVVGDIQANDVLNLAKKYFEKIPARKIPERKPQVEPKQIGERRSVIKAPSELSYLLMGYQAPTLMDPLGNNESSWEPYALEMLSNILAGNGSSRLNQNIVRNQRLAVNVSAGYDSTSRGRISLFELEGTPNDFKKINELENALLQEIEKIKKDGVTQEELDRVKSMVIASDVYQKDSMFGMAMEIGQLETMGYSFHLSDGYIEKVNSVTSEQIKNVATKYLTRDKLSIVILDPQPMTEATLPKGRPHVH
ncbi:MAG: Peptidase domain protein, partial [Pseudomonadota bacterium]